MGKDTHYGMHTVSKSIDVNLNSLRKKGGRRIVLRLCDIFANRCCLARGTSCRSVDRPRDQSLV